jgi:hypothetical protein
MRFCLLLFAIVSSATAAELSVSIGTGPSDASVNTPVGTFTGSGGTSTVLVDGAIKLIGFGPASLSFDVPVAFGGQSNADVFTNQGGAVAYAERIQFALTPGLKVRVGLGLLSPWFSMGIGGARLEQTSASYVTGSTAPLTGSTNRWAAAFSPAGGVDFHPLPLLLLRGEIRGYSFRTPGQLFTIANPSGAGWRTNLLFLAGVGVRF